MSARPVIASRFSGLPRVGLRASRAMPRASLKAATGQGRRSLLEKDRQPKLIYILFVFFALVVILLIGYNPSFLQKN